MEINLATSLGAYRFVLSWSVKRGADTNKRERIKMQIKRNKHRQTQGFFVLLIALAVGVLALGGCVAEAILKRGQEIERKRDQAITNAVDEAAFVYRPRPDHEFAAPPDLPSPSTDTNNFKQEIKDPWYDESGF